MKDVIEKVMKIVNDVFDVYMVTGEFIMRIIIAFSTLFFLGIVFEANNVQPFNLFVQICVFLSLLAYIIRPMIGFVQEFKVSKGFEEDVGEIVDGKKEDSKESKK